MSAPRPFTVLVVSNGTAKYALQTNTDRPDLYGTHKLTGNTGVVYGSWVPTSGRAVRVPRTGWRDRTGVNGTFYVQESGPGTEVRPYVRGWSV